MIKKLATIFTVLLVFFAPAFASDGRLMTHTLRELENELRTAYLQLPSYQDYFDEAYASRHQEMQDALVKANEQSIMLYTQHQYMTFDMSYALQKASSEYKSHNQQRSSYEWMLDLLNFEITRYARLIESLRRLPPQLEEIEYCVVPDSLMYRNDSLDMPLTRSITMLEKEIIRAIEDTAKAPFVLDEEGELYRDSWYLLRIGGAQTVRGESNDHPAGYSALPTDLHATQGELRLRPGALSGTAILCVRGRTVAVHHPS